MSLCVLIYHFHAENGNRICKYRRTSTDTCAFVCRGNQLKVHETFWLHKDILSETQDQSSRTPHLSSVQKYQKIPLKSGTGQEYPLSLFLVFIILKTKPSALRRKINKAWQKSQQVAYVHIKWWSTQNSIKPTENVTMNAICKRA